MAPHLALETPQANLYEYFKDRVNLLLNTDARQGTDELKEQLYVEYTIATREVEDYLYTEVKAKGQGFRESFGKYTITHWPVLAQYLADCTPSMSVPVGVQESLSVAIQARRKHLVLNKKASWGYRRSHQGAIILLERVRDVLEPHFAPRPENEPTSRGHLDGAIDELPTHKQDATLDVGGDQTRVEEHGTAPLRYYLACRLVFCRVNLVWGIY